LGIARPVCLLFSLCSRAWCYFHAGGGQRDSLRTTAEQYLSSLTGMSVSIETLNYIEFFPRFTADMEGIVFKSFKTDEILAEIGEIYFSMNFFSIFFSTGKFDDLQVKGITAKKGVWAKRSLDFRKISMEEKASEGKPALVIEGQYGNDSVSVRMGLKLHKGLGKHPSFRLGDDNTFSLKIGSLEAEGSISRSRRGGLTFNIEKLGVPEKVLSGNILARFSGGKLTLDGELIAGESRVELDLDFKQGVSGTIYFPVLDLADLGGEPGVGALISVLQALAVDPEAPSAEIKAEDHNFDIDIEIPKIQGKGMALGHLKFSVKTEAGTTKIGPFKGIFSGGKLSGAIQLAAKKTPAMLKIKLGMKEWQYGQVQKALYGHENIRGSADIFIEVEGEGDSYDDLLKTLKGKAVLLGGEGEFASAILNMWGGGLVNAIMPDLDPESETKLNCMIAAFKIEDGIATAHTVFIDTKRVTVTGEGEIDIPAGRINLRLNPEAKDVALLDVVPAIRIKGPLFNPSIGPDTISLVSKIGGLLLGAVNPAFLVLSLTDMGVSEDHPCHQYFKEQ